MCDYGGLYGVGVCSRVSSEVTSLLSLAGRSPGRNRSGGDSSGIAERGEVCLSGGSRLRLLGDDPKMVV